MLLVRRLGLWLDKEALLRWLSFSGTRGAGARSCKATSQSLVVLSLGDIRVDAEKWQGMR